MSGSKRPEWTWNGPNGTTGWHLGPSVGSSTSQHFSSVQHLETMAVSVGTRCDLGTVLQKSAAWHEDGERTLVCVDM